MQEWREADRFLARCDDGRDVEIVEYTTVSTQTRGGRRPPREATGARRYRTADGDAVNPLGDGRYEIIPRRAVNADLADVICTRVEDDDES